MVWSQFWQEVCVFRPWWRGSVWCCDDEEMMMRGRSMAPLKALPVSVEGAPLWCEMRHLTRHQQPKLYLRINVRLSNMPRGGKEHDGMAHPLKTTSTATANSWVETWSVIVPAFLCGLIVTIMLLWELLYTAILTLRRNWYFHIDASINLLQLLVASLSSRSSQCCQHCWHDVPEVAFDPLNSTSPKPKPTTRVYWCPSWTMNVRQFHTRGTEANSSRNNVGWNGVRDFFSYLWCPEN